MKQKRYVWVLEYQDFFSTTIAIASSRKKAKHHFYDFVNRKQLSVKQIDNQNHFYHASNNEDAEEKIEVSAYRREVL